MPMTKDMMKTKAAMMKEYGSDKGERIFYAYENKHKKDKPRSKERRLGT